MCVSTQGDYELLVIYFCAVCALLFAPRLLWHCVKGHEWLRAASPAQARLQVPEQVSLSKQLAFSGSAKRFVLSYDALVILSRCSVMTLILYFVFFDSGKALTKGF